MASQDTTTFEGQRRGDIGSVCGSRDCAAGGPLKGSELPSGTSSKATH
jgi:hypothetical protein